MIYFYYKKIRTRNCKFKFRLCRFKPNTKGNLKILTLCCRYLLLVQFIFLDKCTFLQIFVYVKADFGIRLFYDTVATEFGITYFYINSVK